MMRSVFFFDGYCSTVQGLLDWFEVDLGFTELSFIQIDLCVLCVFVLYSRVSLSSSPLVTFAKRHSSLWCVPRCGVLQFRCVAVCCSVLQCVAVCCSVLDMYDTARNFCHNHDICIIMTSAILNAGCSALLHQRSIHSVHHYD